MPDDSIADRLRKMAMQEVANRKIAEFGPAGGNPSAKVQDHIEWKAAHYIDCLEKELDQAKFCLELQEKALYHGAEEYLNCTNNELKTKETIFDDWMNNVDEDTE